MLLRSGRGPEKPCVTLEGPGGNRARLPCGLSLQDSICPPSHEHWDPFYGSFRTCLGQKQSQRVHFCCYSCSFPQPTLSRQQFSNHRLAVNTRDFLPGLTTVARWSCHFLAEPGRGPAASDPRRGGARSDASPSRARGAADFNRLDTQGRIKPNKL